MKAKKFLELNEAKSLALFMVTTTIVLYITKNVFWVSGILMLFLGASALIRTKVSGTELKEKKHEIKKGLIFSLGAIILGFAIEKVFGINLILESILFVLVLIVLKEIYSDKKDKWVNTFVLVGSFLLASGIVLLLIELAKMFTI